MADEEWPVGPGEEYVECPQSKKKLKPLGEPYESKQDGETKRVYRLPVHEGKKSGSICDDSQFPVVPKRRDPAPEPEPKQK